MDRDEGRIAELEEGRMSIYEPGFEELVAGGVSQERLRFATELAGVEEGADILFIAVYDAGLLYRTGASGGVKGLS